jgi:hypothetical protein
MGSDICIKTLRGWGKTSRSKVEQKKRSKGLEMNQPYAQQNPGAIDSWRC